MATKYEDYTVEELRNELRSIMIVPDSSSDEIVPLTEEEMQRLNQIMTILNLKAPLSQEEYHVAEMWEQFKKDHADAFSRLSES